MITKFRLPRSFISPQTPRRISKELLRSAAKAPVDVPAVDPLDAWDDGFAKRAAEEYLDETGCSLVRLPDVHPETPMDVTQLTSQQLGALHGHFAGFAVYLAQQWALADIDAAEARAKLDHVTAQIHLGKSGTVADKKAKTSNDPKSIENEMTALKLEARAKLLKSRVLGYREMKDALSREMSRREAEMNHG